jgi:hypothetical protein
MPKSDLSDLARRRQKYTGEKLHRAVSHLRALCWQEPLPTASPSQAQLELEVLIELGRHACVEGLGWRPGGDPLGIAWLTPLPDALELATKPEALPDIVALLPTVAPDDEPSGIPGLRARRYGAGVELYRLGLPGRIRLPGLSEPRWRHAVGVAYYDVLHVEASARAWRTHPHRMHPDEQAMARLSTSGHASTPLNEADAAGAASALLRRHLLFRSANPLTSLHVWQNADRIELQWYDGPHHTDIIDELLHPVMGLPGTVDGSCRCTIDDDCGPMRLRWNHAAGTQLNLRRGTRGQTEHDEAAGVSDHVRRHAAMRHCREPADASTTP